MIPFDEPPWRSFASTERTKPSASSAPETPGADRPVDLAGSLEGRQRRCSPAEPARVPAKPASVLS
jgi:hypothetical protein